MVLWCWTLQKRRVTNMKRIQIFFVSVFCWLGSAFAAPNALYFMDILPYQAFQNAALQPLSNAYVEIPGLSTISTSLGLGGLSLNDVLYVKDGQLVTFLHPEYGNKDALFAKLQPSTLLNADLDVSVLGFGFKVKEKGYFTFNTSVRLDAMVGLPKDLFGLALYGTPDTLGVNRYDLGSTRATVRSYLDIAGGYSHRINEKWTVGGRLHLLVGVAALQTQFDELLLEASADEWNLRGHGKMLLSMPGIEVDTDEQGLIEGIGLNDEAKEILRLYKPSMGAAVDVGFSYRPVPSLNLSVSLKDIGFMYWNNLNTAVADMNAVYDGVYTDLNEPISLLDSLQSCITGSMRLDNAAKGYFQEMRGKLYVGAEYSFLRNMMSVGLLSKTEFMSNYVSEEISLNYKIRPCHWFGISAGYSFFSGGWSTIGFAMDLKLPPFNFYVATDYTPLYYSAQGVPYRSQAVNVQAGIVLTFKTKDNTKRLTAKKMEIPVDSTKVLSDTLAVAAMMPDAVDSLIVASAVAPVDSSLTDVMSDSTSLSIQEEWDALVAEAGTDVSSSTTVVTESFSDQATEVHGDEVGGTQVVKLSEAKKEE